MISFALVRDGEIVRVATFPDDVPPDLAPNKGAWLPIVDAAEDFAPPTHVLEPPVAEIGTDQVTMRTVAREKTADEVLATRADRVAAIKKIARGRIEARYPLWRQVNMISRGHALAVSSATRPLSEGEVAEDRKIQAALNFIQHVRDTSDRLEADLPQDAAGIYAFDPHHGWPDAPA